MILNKANQEKLLELHEAGDFAGMAEFIAGLRSAQTCPTCGQRIKRKYTKRQGVSDAEQE